MSKLIFARNQISLACRAGFRPMKGPPIDNFAHIQFPCFATPKFDGIRCVTRSPIIQDLIDPNLIDVLTYSLEEIPNAFIKRTLREYGLKNLDGELMLHDQDGKMLKYNPTQSGIMSVAGEPNFFFYVFDLITYDPYWERQERLLEMKKQDIETIFPRIRIVKPTTIVDAAALEKYEAERLEEGYEGVIVRSIDGPYKCGRSTTKEGFMYKVKRFKDAEAMVTGFEELMINDNEATINQHGLLERSSHRVNQRPGDTLGALVCSGHNGQIFKIGSGFTEADRKEIWTHQDDYKMKLVKYKYQPHGMKEAPRSPIFLGWRSPADMDTNDSVI